MPKRFSHFLAKIVTILGLLMFFGLAKQHADFKVEQFAGSDYATVRADLTRVRIKVFWQDSNKKPYLNFSSLQNSLGEKLLAVMNAGIFEEGYKPLGLHIEHDKILRRINVRRSGYGNFYVQPNAVFFLEAGRAKILDTQTFLKIKPKATDATQSGPMLLKAGSINPIFKKNSLNRLVRNGICVAKQSLVFMVLSQDMVNFFEFANYMKHLGCTDGLYLDGNISSMLVPGHLDGDGAFAGMIAVLR